MTTWNPRQNLGCFMFNCSNDQLFYVGNTCHMHHDHNLFLGSKYKGMPSDGRRMISGVRFRSNSVLSIAGLMLKCLSIVDITTFCSIPANFCPRQFLAPKGDINKVLPTALWLYVTATQTSWERHIRICAPLGGFLWQEAVGIEYFWVRKVLRITVLAVDK